MTKAETEKKKSLARTLYMAGLGQNEIADKVDVSRVTVSKWCNTEGWKEARAAKCNPSRTGQQTAAHHRHAHHAGQRFERSCARCRIGRQAGQAVGSH